MMGDRDDELARSFAELKKHEERLAPPFEAVYARALAGRRRPAPAWRRPLATAAALLLAVGGSWLAVRGATTRSHEVVPVWEWRSPTAVLLEVPGTRVLGAMPSDVLDPSQPNGGVR